jgi:hypothetical protein
MKSEETKNKNNSEKKSDQTTRCNTSKYTTKLDNEAKQLQ